jgi:hypothetical protein
MSIYDALGDTSNPASSGASQVVVPDWNTEQKPFVAAAEKAAPSTVELFGQTVEKLHLAAAAGAIFILAAVAYVAIPGDDAATAESAHHEAPAYQAPAQEPYVYPPPPPAPQNCQGIAPPYATNGRYQQVREGREGRALSLRPAARL